MLAEKSSTKISLFLGLSCRNLQSKFMTGSGHHFLRAYELYEGSWTQLGSTEVVLNDRNPQFATPIKVDYYEGRTQHIVVEVFQAGKTRKDELLLSRRLLLGHAAFDLGNLFETCANDQLSLPLITRRNALKNRPLKTLGTLCIRYDKNVKSSLLQIRIQGENIASTRYCGSNNNTLEIFKPKNLQKISSLYGDKTNCFDLVGCLLGEDDWVLVARTEAVNYNPMVLWHSFQVNSSRLCSSNCDIPLKLVVKDYAMTSGKHKIVGSTIKTFNELILEFHRKEIEAFPITNSKDKKVGALRVMQLSQSRLR